MKHILKLIPIFFLFFIAHSAQAAPEIDYQAKVTDDYGKIILDADYNVKFKIWGTETAEQALWEEEYIGKNKIKIENGIFEVKLGQTNPINFDFKEDSYYLSCVVGGKEEEPDWNKGISLVKKIKLADLKFKVDALDVEVSENLNKIIESLTKKSELPTEVSQAEEYAGLNFFSQLWQMVSDLYFNFNQKVEKALASLEKVFIKEAEIEKAQIKTLEISEKIQLYDQITKQAYCVWIENGEWKKVEEKCEDSLGWVDLPLSQENLISEENLISQGSAAVITTATTTTTTAVATTIATSSADNVSNIEENITAATTTQDIIENIDN
ncbi:hypothetical protein KKA93_01205 [Patescibacteria group bacterium]|nr:hypothetical protein [Patescibacteria group bacterium]MBU1663576.1 hypothetical protein [Patescibacteria group bacterium]MBU1934041.1 hypothetical protein [Patescibacteria group bacterium]MBU2007981.1 hypothetical protein [Patescibacteria group bacterium]MBU2264111.1 hypothetical protein [Patescibacteria group bacterium]